MRKALIRSKKWFSMALTAILLLTLVVPQNAQALARDVSNGNLLATSGTSTLSVVPGRGKLVLGDKPLANLPFALKNTTTNQWYNFTSDADGYFTHNLADGTYKVEGLWVSPTWYPINVTVNILNGLVDGKNELLLDGLNLPDSAWNVTGSVKNGDKVFANLTFSLHDSYGNWFNATTDKDGNFKFILPDGSYQIEGIWDGTAGKWYPLKQTFTVTGGKLSGSDTLQINVADNVTGTVKIRTAPLKNTVFSLRTASGALQWFDTKTDSDGNFGLRLPNGSYTIEGIWDAGTGTWYPLNKTFTVADGKLSGSASLKIDIVYNVTGTVKAGTAPLKDTVFSLRTAAGAVKWFDAKTDANGNFGLKLPNGSYTIEGIWDEKIGKWYEMQKTFKVDGSTELNIDVLTDVYTPNVTGVLKKGSEVLPNIVFSVRTTTGALKWYDLTSDANGAFRAQLPNGSYMLEGIWVGKENHWYVLQKEFTVNGTFVLDINVLDQPVKDYTLNIMHTNDTHANLDNVAKKATAIKSVRAAKPNALLLDAGDVLTGTLYFNEYKGLADLEFMNLAGYDAMTFGNHEFDLGTGVLANFVKDAAFPLLSANVNFAKDSNLQSRFNDSITDKAVGGQIYNGMIKVVNGEKIGIFGLTTAETPTISSPGADVVFENYIEEAQKSVDSFKAQGVNKIIALSHLGYNDSLTWDNDLELAAKVEGIDVIVGGHTHVKLDAPVIEKTGEEPTVIVQANEYNKFLGMVDVTFDAAGKVITEKTTGTLLDIATFPEDAAVAQILNTKYKPAIDAKKAQVVGTAAVELVGGNPAARVGETNLGNFIADGMLAKAKTINPNTVIALQNGGGVRVSLPADEITLEEVLKVLPFGNTLAIMDLKGSEIKEALEHSVKTAPATANGAFLQVAGMKFSYDSAQPVGQKVHSIQVKGQDGNYSALDVTKNYAVATNIFTAKGGDGYTMFGKAYEEGRVSEPGFVDWEMFVDHINAQPNKTVNPKVEGRITQAEKSFTLNVMHTNDTHANLDNVAKKMTAIKSVRAEKPNALLLDAGDVLTGTLYFNEYKGLADLEFMNLAGYDAMTFGNHEFDLGTGVLANFVKDADFPLLSANVNFAQDTNLKTRFNDSITDSAVDGQIYNGMIKVVNGEKIGIFGLTTAETPTISSPGNGVVFENYIEEAQKSVDSFKAQGVNKIIALSHLGYNDSLTWDNDLELAAKVEGIDVIVGGHTHVKLDAPVIEKTGVEPTVIVQANEYNKFLGTVDVTFDAAGKVITEKTTGKLLDIATFAEDAATAQILNTKYKPAIDAKKAQVVGTAAVELVGGNPAARTGETNLGNFIADGMLAKAKTINPNTVIALQNGGGVRVTLPADEITLEEVLKVLPFGNALAIMDLKGSEIKEALELSVKSAPATANGGFLQVAGLKFTYDSTKPVGEKVQSIQVKAEDGSYTALDLTKNYAVATNIFTAKGGDGYAVFGKAYEEGRVSEPGFVDWEMFVEYIEAQPNKVVSPQVEGRIVNIAPQVVPAGSFSGTEASPKVYPGDVTIDLTGVTGVTKLQYATVKGNLTIKGSTEVDLSNVTVEGETLFED
ncbi:5'-nucleotidase C-terminal domain-containing protein [Neobacillus niacini]|uniref:5'-nucleotidase C-terminal domain-containing protein n=1 Tax=Neobacillus niacini TaxID=86668 RepID=UPI003B023A80